MGEQNYPEPTVGALILNKEGKILLCRSRKWFGKFSLPGGHVELGETIEAALAREVKEEVGLDVEVERFLLMQQFIFSPEYHKRRHFIFLDYLCRLRGGELKVDNDEIQEAVWARPEDALKMDIHTYTRCVIEAYLRSGKP